MSYNEVCKIRFNYYQNKLQNMWLICAEGRSLLSLAIVRQWNELLFDMKLLNSTEIFQIIVVPYEYKESYGMGHLSDF